MEDIYDAFLFILDGDFRFLSKKKDFYFQMSYIVEYIILVKYIFSGATSKLF